MGGGRWSKVCDIVVVVKVMQEFGIFPADRCKLCMCVCMCVFLWGILVGKRCVTS